MPEERDSYIYILPIKIHAYNTFSQIVLIIWKQKILGVFLDLLFFKKTYGIQTALLAVLMFYLLILTFVSSGLILTDFFFHFAFSCFFAFLVILIRCLT